MRIHTAQLCWLTAIPTMAIAQSSPPSLNVYAIVGAKIEVGDGRVIDKGTVLIRDGIIDAVGPSVMVPPEAQIIKGDGMVAYPGFIDSHATRGLQPPDPQPNQDIPPDTSFIAPPFMREANRKGIRPEMQANSALALTDDILNPARQAGFTTELLVPGGTITGIGSLLNLRGEIRVQCHSYVSDEMLMMVRLSQEYHFKLAALQHGLEAYKIAPEIANAGVGVSTFADAWAYKVEANDAIPYNAALCMRAGIVTSVNSDNEAGTYRLNTEAANCMKFGGLTENEALRLVTINPAIQLGIDKRTGSLDIGKDADITIWDGYPLSVYSRCAMTLVDGEVYYQRRDLFGIDRKSTLKKLHRPLHRGSRCAADASGTQRIRHHRRHHPSGHRPRHNRRHHRTGRRQDQSGRCEGPHSQRRLRGAGTGVTRLSRHDRCGFPAWPR